VTVTIISWYWIALLRAIAYVNTLLALVFAAGEFVSQSVSVTLFTFFAGIGASHFMMNM
jgi:hypothetical protein